MQATRAIVARARARTAIGASSESAAVDSGADAGSLPLSDRSLTLSSEDEEGDDGAEDDDEGRAGDDDAEGDDGRVGGPVGAATCSASLSGDAAKRGAGTCPGPPGRNSAMAASRAAHE